VHAGKASRLFTASSSKHAHAAVREATFGEAVTGAVEIVLMIKLATHHYIMFSHCFRTACYQQSVTVQTLCIHIAQVLTIVLV
jgi:hypothetical protein